MPDIMRSTEPEELPPLWQADRASSRRTDPETSHQAADRVEASGKAGSHRETIREFLENHPRVEGWTSAEIADATKLDRVETARRMSEVARRGPARVCKVNGTAAVTWEVQP